MDMEHYSIGSNQVHSDIKVFFESQCTTRVQNPDSSLPPLFHINFRLSCNAVLSRWIIDEEVSTQALPLGETNSSLREAFIPISLHKFLCHGKARETIAREIRHFHLWGTGRQKVIDFALRKAKEAVISMPPNHNFLDLHFRVAAAYILFYVGRNPVDWMIQHSIEVDEVPMIPAKDSSIESLERKTLLTMDYGNCSICLEEFCRGCEAVCMPCSHVFHGDCIKKWLKTSHYCPICRFEMPTS